MSLRISNPIRSLAAVLWLTAATASAQSPVAWSLTTDLAARPLCEGDRFHALVTAHIEEGWHLYSLTQPPGGPLATRISIAAGQPFRVAGSIEAPLPLAGRDPSFNIETEFYETSVTFTIPVEVVAGGFPGQGKLKVEAFFQTCNDQLCSPPTTVTLETAVTIAADASPGPAPSKAATGAVPTPPTTQDSWNSNLSRRNSTPWRFRSRRWSMSRGVR